MLGSNQKALRRSKKAAKLPSGSSASGNLSFMAIANKVHDLRTLAPRSGIKFENVSSYTISGEQFTDFSILDSSDDHNFIAIRENGIPPCADVDCSLLISVRILIPLGKKSVVTSAHGRLRISNCFKHFMSDEAAQQAYLLGVRFPHMKEGNSIDSLFTQLAPLNIDLKIRNLSVPINRLVVLCMEKNSTQQNNLYRVLVYNIYLVSTESLENLPKFILQFKLKWISNPLPAADSKKPNGTGQIGYKIPSRNSEFTSGNHQVGSSGIALTVFNNCSGKENLLLTLYAWEKVYQNAKKKILLKIRLRNDGKTMISNYCGSSSPLHVEEDGRLTGNCPVHDSLFAENHMQISTSALSSFKDALDTPVFIMRSPGSQTIHATWGCRKCTYISSPLKDNFSQAKLVIYGILSSKNKSTTFALVEAIFEEEPHTHYLIIAWGTSQHLLCNCRQESLSGFTIKSPVPFDDNSIRKTNSMGRHPYKIFLVAEITQDLPQPVRRFLEASKNSGRSLAPITENVSYLSEQIKLGVIKWNCSHGRMNRLYAHYAFLMELEHSVYLAQLTVSRKSFCKFKINRINFWNSNANSPESRNSFSLDHTGLLLRSSVSATPDFIKRKVEIWYVEGLLGRNTRATLARKYRISKRTPRKMSAVFPTRLSPLITAEKPKCKSSKVREEQELAQIALLANFDQKAKSLLLSPMLSMTDNSADEKISFRDQLLSSVHEIALGEEYSRNSLRTEIIEGIARCAIAAEEQNMRDGQLLEEVSKLHSPNSSTPTIAKRQGTASSSDAADVDKLQYSASREFHKDIDWLFQDNSSERVPHQRADDICIMEHAGRLNIQIEAQCNFARAVGECEVLRFLSEAA
ncbi:hypothetical protein XU18_0321 [Perkinsela sp. CCAP 1560/4]|nr:hypothetical protein XU18_0321 [Perkinsela sp. CCAP 1560/4]|eukprot:KNH09636.1 hypothetical protein XU18_0321 [Perkinsela sp. CCAP 1560/4]